MTWMVSTLIQSRDPGSSSRNSLTILREFETSGTYFIRVRYDTGTSTGDYRLRVTDEGLDDSGDTFDAATFVPANDISVSGRLETPGDVDWYEFDVDAEHIYEIVAYESSVDLELRLYDSNGTALITTVDPNSSSTNTLRIRREFETSGTYYIKINQDYSSSSYYGANIGDYTVTIDDQGLDNAGDSSATAAVLAADSASYTGRLETAEDPDWYAFTAEAGHVYRIRASEGPDLEMRLYDQDGSTLIDSVNPNSSSSQTLTIYYEAPTDGTYYIKINQDYSSSSYYGANIGDYTVTIDDQGLDNAGDSSASAAVLAADSASYTGRLETAEDPDWYAFTAEAGHVYRIRASEGPDQKMRLYDQDGSTLIDSVNPNSSSSQTLTIYYEAPTDGTYYIKVNQDYGPTTHYGANIGDYTVTIDDQGLDNAGDSSATAVYWQRIAPLIPDALKPQKTQTGMRLRRKPVMFIESGRLKDQI